MVASKQLSAVSYSSSCQVLAYLGACSGRSMPVYDFQKSVSVLGGFCFRYSVYSGSNIFGVEFLGIDFQLD